MTSETEVVTIVPSKTVGVPGIGGTFVDPQVEEADEDEAYPIPTAHCQKPGCNFCHPYHPDIADLKDETPLLAHLKECGIPEPGPGTIWATEYIEPDPDNPDVLPGGEQKYCDTFYIGECSNLECLAYTADDYREEHIAAGGKIKRDVV